MLAAEDAAVATYPSSLPIRVRIHDSSSGRHFFAAMTLELANRFAVDLRRKLKYARQQR